MTDGSAADPGGGSAPRTPVRTLFLGSGRFAQPILGRLAGHPSIDLVGVVTAPPRPVGRRQVETATPIDTQARELGLTVLTPSRLRSHAAMASILELAADLVVLADYGQIVPGELLDRRYGALNLHPSLLPRHRGASPLPATAPPTLPEQWGSRAGSFSPATRTGAGCGIGKTVRGIRLCASFVHLATNGAAIGEM